MGQYWTIFNIDKREMISLSKLGEWFFDYQTSSGVIQKLLTGTGSWAGDRIVCFGDYSSGNDLPEGLFSEDELKDLKGKDEDKDFYFYGKLCFRCAEIPPGSDSLNVKDVNNYVLRNLSKKEYVRGDGAPKPKDYDEHSAFGQMLIARICWSSDPSTSMLTTGSVPDITRGLWAGDRFDVILREDVAKSLESGEWKDVTEELRRDVEELFDEDVY